MLFYLFVLQDNEDSSSSLGDNDARATTAEEAATVVDEVTAPEVTAVEATIAAETTDNVIAATETVDDATTIAEAVENEVIGTAKWK